MTMRPAVLLGAGAATAVDVIPVSLNITGDASVGEGGTAQYTATVTWSNATTTDETLTATWSDNSEYATIDNSGELTALPVSDDQSVTVSCSYTAGGVTVNDTHAVTISADNHYFDANFYGDATTWPDGSKPFEGAYYAAAPWLTAGQKTEVEDECLMVISSGKGKQYLTTCDAYVQSSGYYKGAGLYHPRYELTEGAFPTKFDALRIVCWSYWTNSNPSDAFMLNLGERAAIGSDSWGAVRAGSERNGSSSWNVSAYDGDGNTTGRVIIAGSRNVAAISSAVMIEFVPGSHATVRLYDYTAAGVKFEEFAMPTPAQWAGIASGEYATIPLTGDSYPALTLIQPYHGASSSIDTGNAAVGRLVYEFRRTGHSWEYLVDS